MSGRFGFYRQHVSSAAPTQPCCNHSKLYHYNSATLCWKCRRPGHMVKECPLKATSGTSGTLKPTSASARPTFTSASTRPTFKSASARRHDQQRMQAFISRKQFPFAQLQDTELLQELQQDSVPTQQIRPVMQQLLHKISRLEGTVSQILSPIQVIETPPVPPTPARYVVSTQTMSSSIHMIDSDCQTSSPITSNLCTQAQVKEFKDSSVSVSLPSPSDQCQKDQIVRLNKTIAELQDQVQKEQVKLKGSAKTIKTLQEEKRSIQRTTQSLSDFLKNKIMELQRELQVKTKELTIAETDRKRHLEIVFRCQSFESKTSSLEQKRAKLEEENITLNSECQSLQSERVAQTESIQ